MMFGLPGLHARTGAEHFSFLMNAPSNSARLTADGVRFPTRLCSLFGGSVSASIFPSNAGRDVMLDARAASTVLPSSTALSGA